MKVCAQNGRCAFAPVWDIGPWNTKDDYWNPSPERQMWKDLPQGRPQAAAAFEDGHNGGNDHAYGELARTPDGSAMIFWTTTQVANDRADWNFEDLGPEFTEGLLAELL